LRMTKSKLDFFTQLLEAAKNGATKAQITSQTSTRQELVDNSLDLLADLNLLTKAHNSPVSFVTTQKGLQFLHDYQHLRKELGSGTDAAKEP